MNREPKSAPPGAAIIVAAFVGVLIVASAAVAVIASVILGLGG